MNTYAEEFIGSFFAKRAGVQPRPFFETTEAARTAPPKVDFAPKPPEPPTKPNP